MTLSDRRLRTVNPPHRPSLPLAELLFHTAQAVRAVRAGESLTAVLDRCPAPARAGTQALSFQTLRWLGSAIALRQQLAPRTPSPAVDALLLTALALMWPSAPRPYSEHTLVDQAVQCARQHSRQSAAFVNAVLRRSLRERDALVAAALRDPVARFNHPQWWIDRLTQDWPAGWAAILDADNGRAPMTLRINPRRCDVPSYLGLLAGQGRLAHAIGASGVDLESPCPVDELPGFSQGFVSVQDAAAQRAAPLLLGTGLRPGARVLDACCAPGGKTAHLLEMADLDVLALDRDASRLARVAQTLARLGLSADVRTADAATPAHWWDGRPFDAILLDAPCSASGIVRRHPDIRWLRRSTDIGQLAQVQGLLLDSLWPLLATGGRFLYCTCSVFKAEGEGQIEAFLQRRHGTGVVVSPRSPGHLLPLVDNASAGPTSQQFEVADGFYYALLEKI